MSAPTLFDLTDPGLGGPPVGAAGVIGVPATEARTAPLVAGLDPSLTGTGIATSTRLCYTVGQPGVTKLPLSERLEVLDALVDQIIRHVGDAALVVIEEPAFSRVGGGTVERHALWWLLVRALHGRGLPLATVPARTRMRYATGKGAATKNVIVDAVARRLPMFPTSGDDNLADAAVLCAMGADWLGHPIATMPATHRAALDAVTWPDLGRGAA